MRSLLRWASLWWFLIPSPSLTDPLLTLETTPVGAVAQWVRSDPATIAAVVTVLTPQGHTRYQQPITAITAYNETLLDGLQKGDRVIIQEFAGIVIDGVPQVAATHRSAGYAVTWRVRLTNVERKT